MDPYVRSRRVVIPYFFVWPIALFVSLHESIPAYGGAMALAGLVGAACGLVLGRYIDTGHGRRVVVIAYGVATLVVILRAASVGSPWLAVTANAILILGAQPSMTGVEAAAGRWIAEVNAPLSSDETTRRLLHLVPAARNLPDAAPGRPLQLRASLDGCASIAGEAGRIEREYRFGQDDPWFRRAIRGPDGATTPALCLLRATLAGPPRH